MVVLAIFHKAFGMPRQHGEQMIGNSPSAQNGLASIWVIDQIENGVASIEIDGRTTITVPRGMLPGGAKEGDVLRVNIALDPAEQARRLAQSTAQVTKGGTGGKGNITL